MGRTSKYPHTALYVCIVSIGDVVKELIKDKEFVIEQLERYIAGR